MSAALPRRPLSLRQRFTLLATLLGLLLGALAAVTLLAVAERYEYVVANEILQGQAEDYGLRLANHMPAQLPRTQRPMSRPNSSHTGPSTEAMGRLRLKSVTWRSAAAHG